MFKFFSSQKWLPTWIRALFCEHTDVVFVRNVSAGEKQYVLANEVHQCKKCGSYIYK